ncbi:MAG: glycosyltransferase [Pseudomonadota bacterium]
MRPAGIVLDVTRLTSRVGAAALTGIDRVENAYLSELLRRDMPLHGLLRTPAGYLLLGRDGLELLTALISGARAPGLLDPLGQIFRKRPEQVRRAEADLRRKAKGRCVRMRLATMLSKHVAPGTAYLNVGHSNLSRSTLAALHDAGLGSAVMIHDTIPLDLPETQRPGTPARFVRRLAAAARARTILTPTRAVAASLRPHLGPGHPPLIPVHLGITLAAPQPGALATRFTPEGRYFLCTGTIDARKNQALLLKAWAELGPEAPALVLAGGRGWGDGALFAQLDEAAQAGGRVVELRGLDDGALAALTEGAEALLHPSHAEGFGIPPLDAALRGIPVICSDIPAHREVLGAYPVYLRSTEMYHWSNAVREAVQHEQRDQCRPQIRPHHPTWDAHLETVLAAI